MNTVAILSKLDQATGSNLATKKTLLACLKSNVRDRFKTEYYYNQIIAFLKWLHVKKGINIQGILNDLNKLDIYSKPSDIIFSKFDLMLREYSHYRFEWKVMRILKWLSDYQNRDVSNIVNALSSSKMDPVKTGELFIKWLGAGLEFYEDSYNNFEQSIIVNRYKKWTAPKFKIIDKYGARGPPRQINENLRVANYELEEIHGVHGQELEKLKVAQMYINKGQDQTLARDLTSLDIITKSLNDSLRENIKKVWEKTVWTFLRANSLKPRNKQRNMLYLYFVYLLSDLHINSILDIIEDTDMELDADELLDLRNNPKAGNYSSNFFNKLFAAGILVGYKNKFDNLYIPSHNFNNIINILEDNHIDDTQIAKIKQRISDNFENMTNLTKRKKIEIIYRILKDFEIKITRAIIAESLDS